MYLYINGERENTCCLVTDDPPPETIYRWFERVMERAMFTLISFAMQRPFFKASMQTAKKL